MSGEDIPIPSSMCLPLRSRPINVYVFTMRRSRTTSMTLVALVDLPLQGGIFSSILPNCLSPGTRLIWRSFIRLTVNLESPNSRTDFLLNLRVGVRQITFTWNSKFFQASRGFQMIIEQMFPIKLQILLKSCAGLPATGQPNGTRLFSLKSNISILDIFEKITLIPCGIHL
jgi:hypothetical protein